VSKDDSTPYKASSDNLRIIGIAILGFCGYLVKLRLEHDDSSYLDVYIVLTAITAVSLFITSQILIVPRDKKSKKDRD